MIFSKYFTDLRRDTLHIKPVSARQTESPSGRLTLNGAFNIAERHVDVQENAHRGSLNANVSIN